MGKNHVIQPGLLKVTDAITGAIITTESDPIDITGAKKVTMMLTRAAHTSGSVAWTVALSLDGVTYEDSAKIITNVANAIAENHVRVASVPQTANDTILAYLDVEHTGARFMKLKATRTTDGTHTAVVAVET